MKTIEVEDDLYQYIASQTQHIGESASEILRRLLLQQAPASHQQAPATHPAALAPLAETTRAEQIEAEVAAELEVVPGIAELIDRKQLLKQKGVVGRFLYLLQRLYETQPNRFHRVLTIRGPHRIYFAMSKEALLAAGSSTNPKQVPNSPYWVISNNNTDKKREMLTLACQKLGYDSLKTDSIVSLLGKAVKKARAKKG